MAAWLGLVSRQYSSGGKEWLGGISKRGSRYVRTLLTHGARDHAASRLTPGGLTPSSAARTIRDDARGTPSAFRPWTHCRPQQGRCAHEEHARVLDQGPDTGVLHREAKLETQPCIGLVHRRVAPRCCIEGWVHI